MSFRPQGVGPGLFFKGVKKQTVAHPSPPESALWVFGGRR